MGYLVDAWINETGCVPIEKEVDPDTIRFEKGYLYIKEKPYIIEILGDEGNIPFDYVSDFGDGSPRVLCKYGNEINDWWLSDIMLHPAKQRKGESEC